MADYYSKTRRMYDGKVAQEYAALGDETDDGDRTMAEISAVYSPPRFETNFDNTTESGYSHWAERKAYRKHADAGEDAPDASTFRGSRTPEHPYFHQDTLFDSFPSSTHVTSMFADPSMTSTALTMVQLAKNKIKSEVLVADDNLSSHSSKLVKNAAKKGLVQTHPANPNAEPVNNTPTGSRLATSDTVDYYKEQWDPVTQGEVMVAQGDVRQVLRSSRKRSNTPVTKKGLSNQFLPGMEGFI